MFEAFTVRQYQSSANLYTVTSSTKVPSGVVRAEYCTWPTPSREASFVVICCTASRAPRPLNSNSPICETSNRPALLLTARCSSRIPAYWTGISQPPNGTILAPSCRWTSNRGRSEEHTSELQSRLHLVCRLLLEKKKK